MPGSGMPFRTPPPSTLRLRLRVSTAPAVPLPSPQLTSTVTSPALPTPPPPLHPVTPRLLPPLPPTATSARQPPRCSICSEPAPCQTACPLCQETEFCTNTHSPSRPSTTQPRAREHRHTTACPVRELSRCRTLSKASGSNRPKSRPQEPVSQVPRPTLA